MMQDQKQPITVIECWNQIAMGDELRPSLIALKETCKDAGQIAILLNEEAFSADKLVKLLSEEDAKSRKNAALVMGQIGAAMMSAPAKTFARTNEAVNEETMLYANALWDTYQKEQTLFVKSSYLKALRLIVEAGADCESLMDALQSRLAELEQAMAQGKVTTEDVKHVTEEIRELRAILPQKERQGHIYAEPSRPVRVILTCRKEIRATLLTAMNAINPEETKEMALGVITKTARINQLAQLRLYQEMLFPLNGMKAIPRKELVQGILEGNLFPLLGILHEPSEEAFLFRVNVPETKPASQKLGQKESAQKNTAAQSELDANKLARQLEAHAKGRLINSVSDYEIELKLIARPEDSYLAFLKIMTKKDDRFSYRKNVVATSMHPVKAAGMVALAKDYLAPKAQLLDPYCGVGTLLIERNRMLAASNVYGIDTFKDAIDGARENSELAGASFYYIHRDSNDFTSEYLFDEIITEMPRWSKEMADEEYRKFFSHSYELMREHGLIIMDSVEKGLIHKHLRLMSEKYRLVRNIPLRERDDECIYIIERL